MSRSAVTSVESGGRWKVEGRRWKGEGGREDVVIRSIVYDMIAVRGRVH